MTDHRSDEERARFTRRIVNRIVEQSHMPVWYAEARRAGDATRIANAKAKRQRRAAKRRAAQ